MVLLDKGFATYTERVEGFSDEVDDLVTYIILKLNNKIFVAAADSVTHRKVLQAPITFTLKVGEVNVTTCT